MAKAKFKVPKPAFTCSKTTTETKEQCVKTDQS